MLIISYNLSVMKKDAPLAFRISTELKRNLQQIADREDIDPQVLWRSVRRRIVALRGDAEAALRLSDEAIELTQETEDILLKAEALVDRSEVFAALGGHDAADFFADRSDP